MSAPQTASLELDDIQAGVLHPRPTPYVGAYILLRVDDRRAGRELLRRLVPLLPSAASAPGPNQGPGAALALSFQGLRALGVPADSLASFPMEFQQGMAARAPLSAASRLAASRVTAKIARWTSGLPSGASQCSGALSPVSPRSAARAAMRDVAGITPIWRQDAYLLPTERTSFGFKDGINHPAVEDSGIRGTNPHEAPFKAGTILLGYPDETGALPPMPRPDVLGHNGSYLVVRKLHTRVAAFRQYLRAHASSRAEEERLAAKIVGRWPSGAPLALAPEHDDPQLGADPARNNAFLYADDPRGLKCPLGAHARRANPRASAILGKARLHRFIRRSTSYGPPLPQGVLEDDGADRGIIFVGIGASLARQFEFVKTQWVNDGTFFGTPGEADPLVGPHGGAGRFTIPQQPIRRRLTDLLQFVVNRGGEHFFLPGLRALSWLADLDT